MKTPKTHDIIDDVLAWIKSPDNAKCLKDDPSREIQTILTHNLDTRSCSAIAFELSLIKIWYSNWYLAGVINNIENSQLVLQISKYVYYGYYSSKIFINVLDTPGSSCRIMCRDIYSNFYLLLAFSMYDQALWYGGRAYLGDSPERFSGKRDEVWTLKEVSEWESLGGDEVGWRGIITKLRRLIPRQKEKERSAGKMPDDPMFPYWQDKPLCGYMLRLWLVMSGQLPPQEIPAGHPACGVYEGLFANWDQPEALASSIIEACDYHVRRSSEDGDGNYDVPEFSMRPYNVIPFEIIAYRNVRRKIGLETPWPSHPLLESPFVKNLPDELPPSDDPLLNDVLAAVRTVLPDV